MIVIGIEGKAGSGKDTLAGLMREEIMSRGRYCHIGHMAEGLKNTARYLFDMSEEDMNTYEGKLSIGKNTYGRTNRSVLQKLGTECFRDVFDENFWLDFAERTIIRNHPEHATILIPDIRFKNEAEWIHNMGGIHVSIAMEESNLESLGEDSSHPSEAGSGILPHYSVVNRIEEDPNLPNLRKKAIELVDISKQILDTKIEAANTAGKVKLEYLLEYKGKI